MMGEFDVMVDGRPFFFSFFFRYFMLVMMVTSALI